MNICPDDPPANPYFAESAWPMYHRNNYRQASTCIPGPQPGDSLLVKVKSDIRGGTSPWIIVSEAYPSGEQVLYYSNATHVFKFLDSSEGLLTLDSLRIDFDFLTSFGWNFLLTADRNLFVPDPKYDPSKDEYTRLFKIADEDPNDPFSSMTVKDIFNFGDYNIGRTQQIALNYRGEIVFNAENDENNPGLVGILSQDFELLDTLQFTPFPGEITYHNAFPVDEENSFYIVTTHRLMCFTWDGEDLGIGWQAFYDFVGDGPTGTFAEGSGTTPTLLGWKDGQDKLVVVSDGHEQNNLVGFWRELPSDWKGIEGEDIRLAGKIELPAARRFSNLFQSIENSPCAYGYDIAIAQYNGFLGQECPTVKGVQKIRWNTESDRFQVAWVNDQINMNNVLTYSAGSNLVYGSGKEDDDCSFYYYGLDWDTGEIRLRKNLGPSIGTGFQDMFDDGGSGQVIDEEGNIYFPGGASLVKLEKVLTVNSPEPIEESVWRVFPNPAKNELFIQSPEQGSYEVEVWDGFGRKVQKGISSSPLSLEGLAPGTYWIKVKDSRNPNFLPFVKG